MSEWGATLREAAVIRLSNGQEFRGSIFLQPIASAHSGPESPADLLNADPPFFPVELVDGQVQFVGKSQVVALSCSPIPESCQVDRLGISRYLTLEFQCSDGSVVVGDTAVSQPPTRQRALDCLNADIGFLSIWSSNSVTYLNRHHVRVARPLE